MGIDGELNINDMNRNNLKTVISKNVSFLIIWMVITLTPALSFLWYNRCLIMDILWKAESDQMISESVINRFQQGVSIIGTITTVLLNIGLMFLYMILSRKEDYRHLTNIENQERSEIRLNISRTHDLRRQKQMKENEQ